MSLRRAVFSVLSLVAITATTSTARADFSLFVIDTVGGTTVELVDGGFGDLDGVVNGSIEGDTLAVEALIGGDFDFTALGGTSDSPGTGLTAFLTQTYQVSGTGSLTIVAAANDYFLDPGTVPLGVTSQATSNFPTTGSGSASFTSYVDDDNTPPQETPVGMATAVLTFASPGVQAKSNGENVPVTGSFALFNESSFTLTGTSLQFTGRTDVTAVPEPASMAMLALGGLGVLGAARRRKAQA